MKMSEVNVTKVFSQGGLEHHFEIVITENQKEKTLLFNVSALGLKEGEIKSSAYLVKNGEHSSYLDFFSRLSKDFGLRMPQNRQNTTDNLFQEPYEEILKENLTSEILYGYGDPAILAVEGQIPHHSTFYYLVVTSNDAPNSFPICRSSNLREWEFVSFVFPEGQKPKWAHDELLISDYWAPEMHYVGDEFRLYYVARLRGTRSLSIGAAISSSPEGPFIPTNSPILEDNAIDPHVFVVDSTTSYLLWKEDNNGLWPAKLLSLFERKPSLINDFFVSKEDRITMSFILSLNPWIKTREPMEEFILQQVIIEAVLVSFSRFTKQLNVLKDNSDGDIQGLVSDVLEVWNTPIYMQKLSQDGLQLVGEKTKIIENDLDWEGHLVEGMWLTKHEGKYYLFYAGNDFSTENYGIGVAISKSLLGPYTKMEKPLLKSGRNWWAPGHPSVALDPSGYPRLFFHAYIPGKAGYKEFRALLAAPIKFLDNSVIIDIDRA